MRRASISLTAAAALVAGCGGPSDPPADRGSAAGSAAAAHDAPPVPVTDRSPVEPPTRHSDDDVPRPPRPAPRAGRPIEIVLRSTPSRATAYVDGARIGLTPTLWAGESGHEHEFTFTRPGSTTQRYQFVAITSGVVHAVLEPIADDPAAGSAAEPPPPPQPQPQPLAPVPVAPSPPPAPAADAAPPPPPPPLDAAAVGPQP